VNRKIKPIKNRKVSAINLYVPPETKASWYQLYDGMHKNDTTSFSEFLSSLLSEKISQITESNEGFLTIQLSKSELDAWNEQRLKESAGDPIPWDAFIIEKVNAGINLLDELKKYTGPDVEEFENEIESLKESNSQLKRQIADLRQEIKIREVTAGRNLVRDAILDALGKAEKPLNFINLAREVDNKKVLYQELMRLLDDDIINVETRGTNEYFSQNLE